MNRTLGAVFIFGLLTSCSSPTEPVQVGSLTLTAPTTSIPSGSTLPLTISASDNSGKPIRNPTITWRSSDESIATVSEQGLVKARYVLGRDPKSASISAQAGSATTSVVIQVAPSAVATVVLPPIFLSSGGTVQLSPELRDYQGNQLSGRNITYTTSDTSLATVSETGLLSAAVYLATESRSITITAISEGRSGSTTVTINPLAVSSVRVFPLLSELSVGSQYQLTADIRSADGTVLPGRPLSWSVSDTSVAVVTPSGLVTALAYIGSAIRAVSVTATSEGKSGSASLSINPTLSDPAALEALFLDASRGWFNTYDGASAVGPLATQAQSYSASWNNFNMNFYSSLDADGTRNSRSWQNDPSSAGRTSVEWFWDGFYTSLQKVNVFLRAVRSLGARMPIPQETVAAEAWAMLIQAASLSGIALNYDRGFYVDEKRPSSIAFVSRRELRDSALVKIDSLILFAQANTFQTASSWTNGTSYSNSDVVRIANTIGAYTIANWPRNAIEAGTTNWSRVISYASKGISTGSPIDFQFTGDGCNLFCPEILTWFNSMDTGRLHTRVANLLDPATQKSPWPAGGNSQPNSQDRRLGDGSFGTATMIAGFGNVPKTSRAGTDFAFSSQAIFNMSRGTYHQSNVAHVRYDRSGQQSPADISGGFGTAPVFSSALNDLLWAEGLLRTSANLSLAATLINNTRVVRGGLPGASGGDGLAQLTAMLRYEMEIELLGLGANTFYLQRRNAALVDGTPREMPVPARVLLGMGLPLYTWGGSTPQSSTPP